jgi:hypothetical protein
MLCAADAESAAEAAALLVLILPIDIFLKKPHLPVLVAAGAAIRLDPGCFRIAAGSSSSLRSRSPYRPREVADLPLTVANLPMEGLTSGLDAIPWIPADTVRFAARLLRLGLADGFDWPEGVLGLKPSNDPALRILRNPLEIGSPVWTGKSSSSSVAVLALECASAADGLRAVSLMECDIGADSGGSLNAGAGL